MGVLWDLLTEQGELYVGDHFVYTSNMHGDGYVNHRFLAQPEFADKLKRLSYLLIKQVIRMTEIDPAHPLLLIGPKSLGADMVKAATETYNQQYGTDLKYAVIDYSKDEAGKKTYFWSPDNESLDELCTPTTQVIWMDDLMNQSSTLQQTRTIFENRCPITAVAVFFDRSDFTAEDIRVPAFVRLEKHTMRAYDPLECPMCTMQKPIRTDLGHGEKFQNANPDHPGGYYSVS